LKSDKVNKKMSPSQDKKLKINVPTYQHSFCINNQIFENVFVDKKVKQQMKNLSLYQNILL